MFKAYRYRIYPSLEQRKQFSQHFGCARWVYNWALNQKQEHYQNHKQTLPLRIIQDNLVALKKTADKMWLKEVNSQSLLSVIRDVEAAYQNFFKKRTGFPCFKKKYDSKQSFQCPQHVKVNFVMQQITLPKIGLVRINPTITL
jgi:putative transposase